MTRSDMKTVSTVLLYCLFPIGYSVTFWLTESVASVQAWAFYIFTVIAYAVATTVPFVDEYMSKKTYFFPASRRILRLLSILCLVLFMAIASISPSCSRIVYVMLVVTGIVAVYTLLY